VSRQFHALATLPQGEKPRYPLDVRLIGPQIQSGGCKEEKSLLFLSGIELRFILCPARYLVSLMTGLRYRRNKFGISKEDNIKVDRKEIGCVSMVWFLLSQVMAVWSVLVNAVMNLPVA
jgi:hypothetical protein